MTDNEITKALEICTSEHLGCEDGCPYRMGDCLDDGYRSVPMKDALDLIKRQKAEIDRLKNLNKSFADIGKFYSEIKSEVIKEFAERLKRNIDEGELYGKHYDYIITIEHIDNLVKEMTVNYESTKLERK